VSIVLLLVLLIIFSILILFYFRNKKTTKDKSIKKEIDPIQKLLVLNINVRKKIVSKSLIMDIERIIDKLRMVIPILNENYQVNELTWVTNKIATDYLQKVLNPYMNFQAQTQKEKLDDLLSSLTQIEKELDETIELVKQNETSQFDIKAKFIKSRFNK